MTRAFIFMQTQSCFDIAMGVEGLVAFMAVAAVPSVTAMLA